MMVAPEKASTGERMTGVEVAAAASTAGMEPDAVEKDEVADWWQRGRGREDRRIPSSFFGLRRKADAKSTDEAVVESANVVVAVVDVDEARLRLAVGGRRLGLRKEKVVLLFLFNKL